MPVYHLAGQGFNFPCPVLELAPFEVTQVAASSPKAAFVPQLFLKNKSTHSFAPSCRTIGWVGGENRRVETWLDASGTLLKVNGGRDFHISTHGEQISWKEIANPLTDLDREILVGPVLVLALALRGTWSLHTSAVLLDGRVLFILGDSGQGKSSLAAHLALTLPLVADDILPVKMTESGLMVWPHFPQLKLPMDAQPSVSLPESLPAGWIVSLARTDPASSPALDRLTPTQATQTILRHTAGTRLFEPDLLTRHLDFCAQAAKQTPAFQLTYPHRRDALPQVQELLQTICLP